MISCRVWIGYGLNEYTFHICLELLKWEMETKISCRSNLLIWRGYKLNEYTFHICLELLKWEMETKISCGSNLLIWRGYKLNEYTFHICLELLKWEMETKISCGSNLLIWRGYKLNEYTFHIWLWILGKSLHRCDAWISNKVNHFLSCLLKLLHQHFFLISLARGKQSDCNCKWDPFPGKRLCLKN